MAFVVCEVAADVTSSIATTKVRKSLSQPHRLITDHCSIFAL